MPPFAFDDLLSHVGADPVPTPDFSWMTRMIFDARGEVKLQSASAHALPVDDSTIPNDGYVNHDTLPEATGSQPVTLHRGPIKSFALPPGWIASSTGARVVPPRVQEIYSPPEDASVRMQLIDRPAPLKPGSLRAFEQIISAPPHLLSDFEIASASPALGESIGNNQYFNRRTPGSFDAPNFKVENAETMYAGGRVVLFVKGEFVSPADINQQPITSFEGIFVEGSPSQASGRTARIYDLSLQAPADQMKRQYEQSFIKSVKNIEWF